ncbi:hypothetical protein HELRODRAFT_175114 [Helobdella robusta]|uniref:Uncharacterized protein n=1 Tax=Helobdella robusta TaxID=6412 RepID=T1F8V6_HELRO|nr:hypothetical protein HELRODRAFT_175114 [Helobdella robusta]ESO01087.1 hypothetical protein HELRODRAFT_175114 [Helobdella robusta]
MNSSNEVMLRFKNSANPYPASSKLTSLQAEQRHLMPSHADLTMAAPSPGHLFQNFPSQLSINSSTPERSFQKDLVAGAFRPKDYLANFNTLFNSMGFYPAPSISNVDRSKHTFKKRKSTRWSIAHVKIAWEIHMDQQKKLSTTITTAPSLTSSSSSTPSKKLVPDKNDCENSSLSDKNKWLKINSEKVLLEENYQKAVYFYGGNK